MKYILKKEYPGSPKLGNTIDNLENDWIENYPEFWKLVVEKDYLITGYYQKPNNIHINITGNFSKSFETEYLIYQVKRLSDGKIFTIGDKILGHILQEIFIAPSNKNDLVLSCEGLKRALYLIEDKHLKIDSKPLFTTEDGVDIFAGMSFYYVCQELELYNTICCTDEKKYKNAKQFSTKEKAEEYILMNKPCLSLNDIENAMDQTSYLISSKLNKFRDYLKSKIQQSV